MTDLEVDENGIAAVYPEEYRHAVAGSRGGLAEAETGVGRSIDKVFDAIERG